jgi:hypothetical protein
VTTHILKFDGYEVGDRLLEGVLFDVHVEETDTDLVIGEIGPSAEHADYLKQINVAHFVPLIRKRVQGNIDHLRRLASERGEQWPTEFLDKSEQEYREIDGFDLESRIALLNEV